MSKADSTSVSKPDLMTQIDTDIIGNDTVALREKVAMLRSELNQAIKNPPKTPKTRWEKLRSFATGVSGGMAAVSVAGLCVVYISAESRADCQAAFNRGFQRETSVRVTLSAPENEARDVIFSKIGIFLDAPTVDTGVQVRNAISKYEIVRAEADQKRAANPVNPPNNNCD